MTKMARPYRHTQSSANAKKVGSPRARGIDNDVALTPDETYTYNIAELLENVKDESSDKLFFRSEENKII